jgi:hypothetical protein
MKTTKASKTTKNETLNTRKARPATPVTAPVPGAYDSRPAPSRSLKNVTPTAQPVQDLSTKAPAAPVKHFTPSITAPRSAACFTIARLTDGKTSTLPVRSLKPILINETRPFTIQFHLEAELPASGRRTDVEGLYTVAVDGTVTQAESKQVTVAPVEPKAPKAAKATKPAGDGFPSNAFDRACWEEVIKGGTADAVAARVVARFADEKDEATKKYRTNPKNVLKYHAAYVAEVKAAGLLK